MHITELDIRPHELDSFGHVNNARYLEYLEWARLGWCLEYDLTYERFHELEVIPAVVEANLRFQCEAKLGDRLRIETRPELVHSAKIVFHQNIFNQNGRRVMKATITVVSVDMNTRSFTAFPEVFVRAVRGDPPA